MGFIHEPDCLGSNPGFTFLHLRGFGQLARLGFSSLINRREIILSTSPLGFPGGIVVKNPPVNAGRHKRHRFDPWVRKIPWRRAGQPTPVFLPLPWTEEPGRLQSIASQELGTIEVT